MITEYLIRRQAYFFCDRCGDSIHQNIPPPGNIHSHRYCCGLTYEITTLVDGSFTIEPRVQTKEEKEEND